MLVTQAPWTLPNRVAAAPPPVKREPRRRAQNKVVCCHFLKSNANRPILEAECRAKDIPFAKQTTRLMLAALLYPNLPDFCSHHENKRPLGKPRKPKAPAADAGGAKPVEFIFMRGGFERKDGRAVLRGVWAMEHTPQAWREARAPPPQSTFERVRRAGSSFDESTPRLVRG